MKNPIAPEPPLDPNQITWKDIPQFPRVSYEVDVFWGSLERNLEHFKAMKVDLDPDYQRGHVWTMAQRRAWLEYILRGGEIGRTLVFACSNWNSFDCESPDWFFQLADGKQRLKTVRMFMRDEIALWGGVRLLNGKQVPPEGLTRSQMGGQLRELLYSLKFRVVDAPTRLDALNLYLAMNAGGTPHPAEEIARVTALRDEEIARIAAGGKP